MYYIATRWINWDGSLTAESDIIPDEDYKIIERNGYKSIVFESAIYKDRRAFFLDELGVIWVRIYDENHDIILNHYNDSEETLIEWKKELTDNVRSLEYFNDARDFLSVAQMANKIINCARKIRMAEEGWE